jgi:hypothetical protein
MADSIIECVSAALEIVAFFLVTSELFGKENVAVRSKQITERVTKSFSWLTSGAESEWRSAMMFLAFLAMGLGLLALLYLYVSREYAESFVLHKHWTEPIGARAEGFLERWYAGVQGNVWLQILATVSLVVFVGMGVAGFFLSIVLIVASSYGLYLFAMAKLLFAKHRPENGFLVIGALLFVAAKLLIILEKSLPWIWPHAD